MKYSRIIVVLVALSCAAFAQDFQTWLANLPQAKDYIQKRSSSYDRTGAYADARQDPWHLKALVLRAYWDGESNPSIETPVGDFFGLGLGDYYRYQSIPLSVGSDKALNCFLPMPFQKHARITITNEGTAKTDAFYFNIDFRAYTKPLPADQLYFHAQYRQANPNHGWTADWKSNGDPRVNDKLNLIAEGNYVWMEATGHGHFVGVTMSVLQNQDDWWGEGDDMFFIDGESKPSINGTGSED